MLADFDHMTICQLPQQSSTFDKTVDFVNDQLKRFRPELLSSTVLLGEMHERFPSVFFEPVANMYSATGGVDPPGASAAASPARATLRRLMGSWAKGVVNASAMAAVVAGVPVASWIGLSLMPTGLVGSVAMISALDYFVGSSALVSVNLGEIEAGGAVSGLTHAALLAIELQAKYPNFSEQQISELVIAEANNAELALVQEKVAANDAELALVQERVAAN